VPTYSGWDRFGRVVQQTWTVDGSAVDSYAYGYDPNSNRLYRENLQTSNFDELYEYDDLNRLIDMGRGNLDQSKLFLSNTAYSQTWTLDQLGNWTGLDDDGTTQTRTHNAVNEITDITDSRGWIDPTYDSAGNMISGPTPGDEDARQHYAYDAWNRMVTAKADSSGQPGATIAVYEYDGLNRRIEKTVGQDSEDFFFNEQWQVLEVRLNGDADPLEQCLWDIRYIDAMVVRWFDGNTDGDYADLNYLDGNQELVIGVDSILFYCQDANMNTTAMVDGAAVQSSVTAGQVVEYYAFSAYGVSIVMEADWTVRPNGSAYENWSLFAGYYFDEPSGLYLVRNRVYQAELGRWVQRDPVEYFDANTLYAYGRSSPGGTTDPAGLAPAPRDTPGLENPDSFTNMTPGEARVMMHEAYNHSAYWWEEYQKVKQLQEQNTYTGWSIWPDTRQLLKNNRYWWDIYQKWKRKYEDILGTAVDNVRKFFLDTSYRGFVYGRPDQPRREVGTKNDQSTGYIDKVNEVLSRRVITIADDALTFIITGHNSNTFNLQDFIRGTQPMPTEGDTGLKHSIHQINIVNGPGNKKFVGDKTSEIMGRDAEGQLKAKGFAAVGKAIDVWLNGISEIRVIGWSRLGCAYYEVYITQGPPGKVGFVEDASKARALIYAYADVVVH